MPFALAPPEAAASWSAIVRHCSSCRREDSRASSGCFNCDTCWAKTTPHSCRHSNLDAIRPNGVVERESPGGAAEKFGSLYPVVRAQAPMTPGRIQTPVVMSSHAHGFLAKSSRSPLSLRRAIVHASEISFCLLCIWARSIAACAQMPRVVTSFIVTSYSYRVVFSAKHLRGARSGAVARSNPAGI